VSIECDGGRLCDTRKNGGRDQAGLTHLTAALFSEGPEDHTPLEWHRLLDKDAIGISVGAGALQWRADIQCLSEVVDRAMVLAEECLARPGFPELEWKQIVKAYRANAREQWAQPANVIGPLGRVQVLGYGHPNAHPACERSYSCIRYEDACIVGRGAFGRVGNLLGMIGGDIEVEDGFRCLRELIQKLPEGAIPPESNELPKSTSASKRIWVLDHSQINQVFLSLGRTGICAGDLDRVAMRMANYAIGGGGFSSRLMQRVRSEMGQTYGIQSTLPEDQVASPFTIQTFTQTDNLARVLDLIDRELDAIVSDGFRAEELQYIQDHLHGAVPLGLTTPGDVLSTVVHGLRAGIAIDDLELEWHAIRQISLEQLNAAARRIIGDNDFHLALVGPARMILPQIEGRGDAAIFPFTTTPDQWCNG